jgi:hypothetical protein
MATPKEKGLIRKIVLPFPLPTWNRLLSQNRWGRAKLRHWIHDAVKDVINGIRISGDRLDVYYQLIRPKAKKKGVAKKKRRKR